MCEENEIDLNFKEIFDEELKILEELESEQVFQKVKTKIDTSFSDLTFKELFTDELKFLKNLEQPNYHTSTMNLGFEKKFKE